MSELCAHLGLFRHHKTGKPVSRWPNKPKLDTHSRIVFILKISLFVGVAILSAGLFTIAKSNRTALEKTQYQIQDVYRERLLSNPDSVGLTERGASYRITADRGVRGRGITENDTQILENVEVTLKTTSELITEIKADLGSVSASTDDTILSGNVRAHTSDGYQLETEEITSNLNLGTALSRGPVLVNGPNFILNSGQMAIEFGADLERYIFSHGVKIIYESGSLTQ